MTRNHKQSFELKLHAGELVEVRSASEILSTLDERGALDALPFMPEMLKFCGQRFKVFKRADKTCDTIDKTGLRRMKNAVHLEGLRCDGEAHGGCQAGCLLFWKEAWLKRVQPLTEREPTVVKTASFEAANASHLQNKEFFCTEAVLMQATRVAADPTGKDEEIFSCQTTELKKATTYLAWWDIRQYVRDVWYGNAGIGEVMRTFMFWLFTTKALKLGAYRAQIQLYNKIQEMRGGVPYPFENGKLRTTPSEQLNLQPGELVQVKSRQEIVATLDTNNKNRGLWFDAEMAKYCGRRFKVLSRVERIIHEKTGRMINLTNDCLILEGVTCDAEYCHLRWFCPRSMHPYWREIWLKRIE